MAAVASIYVEVEENENCEYMPLQVFEARDKPVLVKKVWLLEPGRKQEIFDVTGWSSDNGGIPCSAMYAPVSDSGQAEAYIIIGGDWGVRMRPSTNRQDWDLDNPCQCGEPFLWLAEKEDVILC